MKQQVGQKTFKSALSPICRSINCKSSFKIKHNHVYYAWLITCGKSQVVRVNFTKNFWLVMNDILHSILMMMMIYFGFLAKVVDVETAYLYRELEEEIYMECPPGIKDIETMNVSLCFYGLVQAAIQCNKKAVIILKKVWFTWGNVDPCLYMK